MEGEVLLLPYELTWVPLGSTTCPRLIPSLPVLRTKHNKRRKGSSHRIVNGDGYGLQGSSVTLLCLLRFLRAHEALVCPALNPCYEFVRLALKIVFHVLKVVVPGEVTLYIVYRDHLLCSAVL